MADNPPSAAAPPAGATDAVLVKSEEMPKDAQRVEELDFNKLTGPITAEDLLLGMRHMGFQASSIAEAVRIINDMVNLVCHLNFLNYFLRVVISFIMRNVYSFNIVHLILL